MPYQTDERLKNYLDTNQLQRERMCRAILAIDKRFSEVRPRHPRGGPDGGRDIQAIYREEQTTFGAVGFVNQANDSEEQKRTIKKKFIDDLESASSADIEPKVFIFFTNINLTLKEKENLIAKAKKKNLLHCEIMDREILRIALDNLDGFSIRFQYLNIPLSEAEQASFFAKWGDDIQSVISTGFQKIENTLNRILFFQEASDSLIYLTFSFELDKEYDAEEIGHFRLFCSMHLKELKHKIFSILFGSFDRTDRIGESFMVEEKVGIKHGISGAQWEQYLSEDKEKFQYSLIGSSAGVGMDIVKSISITYSKDDFVRISPNLNLKDFYDLMYLPILNKSLVKKIKTIHIYANGYKLQEIHKSDFNIDYDSFKVKIPIEFSSNELQDSWVRIRPNSASAFKISFFDKTPKRMYLPKQINADLDT